jgi:hypothetical protein
MHLSYYFRLYQAITCKQSKFLLFLRTARYGIVVGSQSALASKLLTVNESLFDHLDSVRHDAS